MTSSTSAPRSFRRPATIVARISSAHRLALVLVMTAAVLLVPGDRSKAATPFSARIDTAGAGYTDPAGRVWSADRGYVGGAAAAPTPNAIAGTTSDPLYAKHRWAMSGYDVAVPCPSRYRVDLHFAETYWYAAGQRVFGVGAEGVERISGLDVLAVAGKDTALVRSFEVDVADGSVSLAFTKVVENPMVSGIEVTQITACAGAAFAAPTTTITTAAAPPPVAAAPVVSSFSAAVSAGGLGYMDSAGRVWEADRGYVGGAASGTSPTPIAGTADGRLYTQHRWGMSSYDVPVPCAARYRVDLHFAETYWYAPGQRVFSVSAEGAEKVSRVDVVASVGKHTALLRSFEVDVADGSVSLGFTKVVENPMVSGIEVTQLGACTGGTTLAAPPAPVYDVPTSIAANCSRSVDAEIRGWLAQVPDHAVARFAAGGCYGQDGPIELVDRTGLTIDGNGATFKALTQGSNVRRNWRLQGGSAITLKNMTVRGANPRGGILEGAYNPSFEFQHGYSVEGTQGATLDNVQAFDVYGDFVAIHHDERYNPVTTAPARNITIRNARFERNGRQGISPTNVEGFVLENSYLGSVNMNAIDIELDFNEGRVTGVKIVGNTFGSVRFSLLGNVGAGYEPIVGDITLDRNTMVGPLISCRPPVYVETPDGLRRAGYTVTNNRLLAYGDAFDFTGTRNVTVAGNTVTFTDGGCGTRAGVGLIDSHTVSITGNSFVGAAEVVKRDGGSTGVTVSGNTL